MDYLDLLEELIDAHGEGEVTIMSYDFLPAIEVRLVSHNCSVAQAIHLNELRDEALSLKVGKSLLAKLAQEIKINGQ